MQVILLERIGKLGQMGDEVTVRDGFARNYLLPQGKALRATKTNHERFERDRAQLEARNLELKSEAQKVAERLEGQSFIVIRQAGDTGQLYGSVSPRDIAGAVTEGGFSVERHQVLLPRPIKTLGLHEVHLSLHPEVKPKVNVNVARSPEEAARQARGEEVTAQAMEEAEEAEAAKRTAEELFEEGGAENLDEEEGSHEDQGHDGQRMRGGFAHLRARTLPMAKSPR
jgi:large subunit ribosomal protein L9